MIPLLIIILTLIIDIITDLRRWGRINHNKGFWLRMPSFIVSMILDWHVGFAWCAYWAMFDMSLAIGRGLPLLYIGTTSKLDKLQRRYSWLQAVKYALGAAGVIFYIWL